MAPGWPLTLLVALVVGLAGAHPMYYKKVAGQKYEPDWVAVSSTVIPLLERKVSVGGLRTAGATGEAMTAAATVTADHYKEAYAKHVSKSKLAGTAGASTGVDDPDTLITDKKRFFERKTTS